jgi:kumamolisin
VKWVLEQLGLTIGRESPATGSVIVCGTAARIEATFKAGLGIYESTEDGVFRGREASVAIPAELKGLVSGVFGLDQRRVAQRTMRNTSASGGSRPTLEPLGPRDLEKRYRFPRGSGAGQTIAIAEFGGGYFPDDVHKFCNNHRRPTPHVTTVPVGLAPLTQEEIDLLPRGERSQHLGECHEVMMDVEIVAGLCPRAEICVYFAPFDQKGWIDLLDRIIGASPPLPAAVSVSWGLAEDSPDWTAAALTEINRRLHAASLLGITVCAAAGDDGSGDDMGDGRAHVHFPASSPFVLAVGGTMIGGSDEVVWWDSPGDRSSPGGGSTGGGVSVKFARPKWQKVHVSSLNHRSIDGRIVPDVAALAGHPGYRLVFGGRPTVNGGTSAAAPVWASLVARIAGHSPMRRAVFVPPLLYGKARAGGESVFADIVEGNNASPQPGRGYSARPGYDAVTGWGVPNGRALAASI